MSRHSPSLTFVLDENKAGPKQYASIFPYEIWRECFMLLDMKDHKNLARTCHLFHDICLPFILKSITYSLKFIFNKKCLFGDMAKQLQEFTEHEGHFLGLIADDRRRALVRKLTLAHSLKLAPRTDEMVAKSAKDAYDMYLETFMNCVPLFSYLNEIDIRFNKNLDKKLLSALATLPQLEQLSLFSVKFGAHVSKPLIKVRKLLIDNKVHDSNPIGTAKRLEVFSGEALEELKILSRAYGPKLFRSFANQKTLKQLKHLSFQLHSHELSTLEPFLEKCPKLSSINADFGIRSHVTPTTIPPLPPSTIPHLNSFTGYDAEVEIFVPKRPVRKVILVQPDKWIGPTRTSEQLRKLFANLSKSTGPICDLHIDMALTPELMDSITTHFPQLSQLGLQLDTWKQVFPCQDPIDVPFEDAVMDQILLKGWFVDPEEDKGSSAKHFPQIYLFNVYVRVLHWIAHKKIVIPPRLETLFLEVNNWYLHLPEIPQDPDSLYVLDNRFQHILYLGFIAELIFKTLSIHYPTLHEVVIGARQKNEIRWEKDLDGNWSCSRVRY
ncbi:hypothetical protein CPB84DRAFT_1961439 [Gymnopilus junonius]|uniref:F-box domain-containing protein n=1 Tax=Gymnopilus junonius TaxID=109634 RepID=A0A9P5NQ83_GYMJU|nr:hypothetical protein CPB84DRAFT_1961439 [Gymnopilus junonius]